MDEIRRDQLQTLDGLRLPSDRATTEDATQDAASEAILSDPQTAVEFARRRAFDAAVAEAFAQVPLPLGMAARLMTALEAEAAGEQHGLLMPAAVPAMSSAAGAPTPVTAVEAVAPPLNRRSWLATAGSALAATAAGGAFFVWWQNRHRPDLTVEQVLESALVFHQRAAARRGDARPTSERKVPEFPLSRFVEPRAEPRVRPLDEPLLGRTGVVYELAPADQPRASLYVISERPGLSAPAVPNLAAAPMAHPFMTGGCAMSAWREDHRIVLLIVDGDERRYREYFAGPQVFA
jgi:hypothetical protein